MNTCTAIIKSQINNRFNPFIQLINVQAHYMIHKLDWFILINMNSNSTNIYIPWAARAYHDAKHQSFVFVLWFCWTYLSCHYCVQMAISKTMCHLAIVLIHENHHIHRWCRNSFWIDAFDIFDLFFSRKSKIHRNLYFFNARFAIKLIFILLKISPFKISLIIFPVNSYFIYLLLL